MSRSGHAPGLSPIRLMWDEQLSPRVADALRALGFHMTRVGRTDDGAPPKGSGDAVVLAFAQKTHQTVVTSNHDMMTLCDEAGQRFVWLDPHGRHFRLEEQVLLAFQQIRSWGQILDEHPDRCVRALRTKCEPIQSDEAARLAVQRMRSLERKRRARVRRRQRSGQDPLDGLPG